MASKPTTIVRTKSKAVQGTVMDKSSRSKLIKEVIELIGNGMSEREACRTAGIDRSTFRVMALRYTTDTQYVEALYGLAQDQVRQVEQTIDDMRNGVIDAQMARVEIDTRKWFASKFLPKFYGDKIDMTTNGKDMTVPILDLTSIQITNNNKITGDTEC